MNNAQKYLSAVYPSDQVFDILSEIEVLIHKYGDLIHKDHSRLTQKDICLISYGDQLSQDETPKLQVLDSFLKEYLSEISVVHILPFYPYSSDDGFSVIDYYKVNPDLGDWKDIIALSKHKKLMFDAVINHISQYSDWFKGFLNGSEEFREYFIQEDPRYSFSEVVRPRVSPLLHGFEDHTGNIRHIWTTFSKDQVDLNYKNSKVFLHVVDVLLWYLSQGAKLLRLDAIGFMWKKKGTSSIHLDETHYLIKAIREVLLSVQPNVTIITETNVPHLENISYFGNGNDEAHMVYNFTLPPLLAYSLLTGNVEKLYNWAQTLELPSKEVCFFNFTASHDGIGVRPVQGILNDSQVGLLINASVSNDGLVSYKKNSDGSESPYEINCNYFSLLHGEEGNKELGIKRFLLSQLLVLTMPGLPALYFHSVIGSENDIEGVKKTGHNRSINREKLRESDLIKELEDPNNVRSLIYKTIKKAITVRIKEESYDPYANFRFQMPQKEVLSVEREKNGSKTYNLFNFSNQEVVINLDANQSYINLLDQERFAASINMKPLSCLWLKIDS